MNAIEAKTTPSLSDLPDDELIRYGCELGLELREGTPRGELLRRIRERQERLLEIDHDALLDIVVWARRPVRQSAGKEALARQIADIDRGDYERLSLRGLEALALLRGLNVSPNEPRDSLERRVRKAEKLWTKVRRVRRSLIAGVISRAVNRRDDAEYQFLPEDDSSLRSRIEDQGVVGGIARKLKGVADDYVREKLDEIEARIDRKLDEIDNRLAEWRDREIANRLKILKLTLIVSILVALISLGYDLVSSDREAQTQKPAARSELIDNERQSVDASTGDSTRPDALDRTGAAQTTH